MDGKEWRKKHRTGRWENESDSGVLINSQEELDEVPADYKGFIYIQFGTEEKRAVLDRELNANIWIFLSSVIEIRKPNEVIACSGSIVYAWNKDGVEKINDAKVYDLEERDKETVSLSAKEYKYLLKCKDCVEQIMNSMKEDQTKSLKEERCTYQ